MLVRNYLSALGIVLLPCSSAAPAQHETRGDSHSSLVIQTTSGTVHGAINASVPGVRQFLGIPFAQNPIGDLRFALPKPLPANASDNQLDATTWGPNCPQYESTVPSVYNKIVREFFIWGSSGDDCLRNSIWAPANPTGDSLPVVIFIYGGGATTGGSTVPYQNPQKWVQRTQSHIVVSLQYRVNFFGAPNAPFPGGAESLAFFDARLAMEWIRDNIAAFGGDPSRMVVWGQSAGAALVGQLALGYPEDPIVHGFIQDSGARYDVASNYTDSLRTNFTFLGTQFGCEGSNANITACLRKVPQADLESFIQYWVDAGRTPPLSFQFRPNNVTTFANNTDTYLKGHYAKLPKIIGNNKMDGASLGTIPPIAPYDQPPPPASQLAADLRTKCPGAYEARLRNYIGVTTYRFQYNGNFSNISPQPWLGAYHSSELPLVFGSHDDFRGPSTPFEIATSEMMQDFWLAFAEDPENGPANLGWPKYATGQVEILGDSDGGVDVTKQYVPRAQIEKICEGYYSYGFDIDGLGA